MNAIYRISLSFLMAVGTVCPAAAGLPSPIPKGVPEEHHRFFEVVTGGKALGGLLQQVFLQLIIRAFIALVMVLQ